MNNTTNGASPRWWICRETSAPFNLQTCIVMPCSQVKVEENDPNPSANRTSAVPIQGGSITKLEECKFCSNNFRIYHHQTNRPLVHTVQNHDAREPCPKPIKQEPLPMKVIQQNQQVEEPKQTTNYRQIRPKPSSVKPESEPKTSRSKSPDGEVLERMPIRLYTYPKQVFKAPRVTRMKKLPAILDHRLVIPAYPLPSRNGFEQYNPLVEFVNILDSKGLFSTLPK